MRWEDMNGHQKAYAIRRRQIITGMSPRSGRCAKCGVRYRWTGAPKLADAKCMECGSALKRTTCHAHRTVQDVDGEWLQ
jgi:hypothetical protein